MHDVSALNDSVFSNNGSDDVATKEREVEELRRKLLEAYRALDRAKSAGSAIRITEQGLDNAGKMFPGHMSVKAPENRMLRADIENVPAVFNLLDGSIIYVTLPMYSFYIDVFRDRSVRVMNMTDTFNGYNDLGTDSMIMEYYSHPHARDSFLKPHYMDYICVGDNDFPGIIREGIDTPKLYELLRRGLYWCTHINVQDVYDKALAPVRQVNVQVVNRLDVDKMFRWVQEHIPWMKEHCLATLDPTGIPELAEWGRHLGLTALNAVELYNRVFALWCYKHYSSLAVDMVNRDCFRYAIYRDVTWPKCSVDAAMAQCPEYSDNLFNARLAIADRVPSLKEHIYVAN